MSEHKAREGIAAQTQAMAQEYFSALCALDEAFMAGKKADGVRGRDATNAAASAMMRVLAQHYFALELMGIRTRAELEMASAAALRANLQLLEGAMRKSAN